MISTSLDHEVLNQIESLDLNKDQPLLISDADEANKAAKLCIINTLIILNSIDNNIDLNNLSCVQLSGFVNADSKFDRHPEVINGASDFICEVLSENGKHTRIAVGCNSLPKNACVEISSIFSLDE